MLRVTEILAPYQNFSGIPPDVLSRASERGTLVHRICAVHAKGLAWLLDITSECQGYADSFKDWFKNMVQEVVFVEKRLADKDLGFTGQIDLLVRLKSGKTVLIDLKTPAALGKTWRMQLAAYAYLARKEVAAHEYLYSEMAVDQVGSLRLSKKGNVGEVDWLKEEGRDLAAFMNALSLANYLV